GYILTQRTGSGVGASQDAYRIFLKTNVDPHVVAEAIRSIDPDDVERLTGVAVERTGLFKRRLLHVSKRMGIIEKDADVNDLGLTHLLENLRGTVIYKEAMKEALFKDLDVEGTIRVARGIIEGEYEVRVMPGDLPLSPMSRTGIRELSWKTDLVPADRLRRLLIESGKARLLNEARVAVCANCFRYVENVKVKRFMTEFCCPECGSKKIGLLSDDPSEVAQMAAERSDLEKVSERFKGVYKEAIESGELVGAYGLPAALALAAKGISKPIMITLATSKMGDLDYFVDTILREERAAMKARMRRLRQ
ncbi:MAG TPA: hypothetical protein PKX17_05965, partial [Candidatus Methanomethylicus sp.]|nr:hypothetical protein [Candidatus Methanomethylicus sp.]